MGLVSVASHLSSRGLSGPLHGWSHFPSRCCSPRLLDPPPGGDKEMHFNFYESEASENNTAPSTKCDSCFSGIF